VAGGRGVAGGVAKALPARMRGLDLDAHSRGAWSLTSNELCPR